MSKLVVSLIVFSLPILAVAQDQTAAQKLKQMEWLLGSWTRTNSPAGKSGFETWKRSSDNSWTGRGITMKGTDTTFVEKLRIIIENNKLFYVADVPENKKAVYFEVT